MSVVFGLTLGQPDLLHGPASGHPADAFDDLGPVHEKLVADNRMRRVHLEPAPLVDPHRVRVTGVGRPHDLRPLFANRLFRRWNPDPMLCPQGVDEIPQLVGGAPAHAARVLRGYLSQ